MSDALPTWPIDRIGEAIEILADRAGFLARSVASPPTPARIVEASDETIARFVERTADAIGIESEAVDAAFGDVDAFVARSAPALVRVPGPTPEYLAVVRVVGHRVQAIGPDLQPH